MVNRINLLLQAKNITARQFAEEIGIQPSGMSHILSGRNNPSLDFVMKVMKRWPEVNINWLMFGNGEMFTNVPINAPTPIPKSSASEVSNEMPDLFTSIEEAEPIAPVIPESTAVKPLQPEESVVEKPVPVSPAPQKPIFDQKPQLNESSVYDNPQAQVSVEQNVVKESSVPPPSPIINPNGKKIVKLIVLYEDHSFSEYYPE